ncbi:MAG: hypothetical protein GOU97_04680 [Nanoarchaeota archaeon]|nr:hypothetical protein [Nanoarchaeota archaeon]
MKVVDYLKQKIQRSYSQTSKQELVNMDEVRPGFFVHKKSMADLMNNADTNEGIFELLQYMHPKFLPKVVEKLSNLESHF